MDRLTKEQRSSVMAKIRAKNTKPEIYVRRLVHKLGYRFRLHRTDLPGKPDIVFVRLRKVIFINGCFWHAHQCKHGKRIPEANRSYWIQKRRKNFCRDRASTKALEKDGWFVLTIWECELTESRRLVHKIKHFLEK